MKNITGDLRSVSAVATHASDAHLVLLYMAAIVGILAYFLSSRRFHQGKKIQKDVLRATHPL